VLPGLTHNNLGNSPLLAPNATMTGLDGRERLPLQMDHKVNDRAQHGSNLGRVDVLSGHDRR
jgi:hypothetical protein